MCVFGTTCVYSTAWNNVKNACQAFAFVVPLALLQGPIPSFLLRPSSPWCPLLLLCSLAGLPPVQHKRYAKLFIRIAPQGELKGAGQARGVQQFKKICETVCVSLYVCVCECQSVQCAQGLERTSQAVPSRAQLMLIFCGCCCCPRGNLNSAINV